MCSVKTVDTMEEFYGKKYILAKSEHFDDLLEFLDIGYLQRKVAMTLSPVQYISRDEDGFYTIYFQCKFIRSHNVTFRPGVEFFETKPDGIKVRALATIEGNKIYHRQQEDNGRTLNHVYEFFPDNMILTTTAPGFEHVVKRYYDLLD